MCYKRFVTFFLFYFSALNVISRAVFKLFKFVEMLALVTTDVNVFRNNIENPPQDIVVYVHRCQWRVRRVREPEVIVRISHPEFEEPSKTHRTVRFFG